MGTQSSDLQETTIRRHKMDKQIGTENSGLAIDIIEEDEETLDLIDRAPKYTDVNKAIELRAKGLTYKDIAIYLGVSKQAVHQRLKGIMPEDVDLQPYKNHRADILAAKQAELLKSLTPKDIKDSSPYQKVGMFGILYDKERLERGESTQNVAIAAVYQDIDMIRTELERRGWTAPGNGV